MRRRGGAVSGSDSGACAYAEPNCLAGAYANGTGTASSGDLWTEYLTHSQEALGQIPDLYDSLTAASATMDAQTILTASSDLADFVDSEDAWLTAHPPAPCFAAAHAKARAVYAAFGDAAKAFNTWAAGYPSADDSLVPAGLRYIQLALTREGELTTAIGDASC